MATDSTPTETELLLRIGAGDQEAFARFYDRTVNVVFGVACRFLRDRSLAEDLVQDVYLQVWEKGRTFNPDLGRPMTWLLTLTRNRAVDRLRAAAWRREATESSVIEGTVENPALDAESAQAIRRAVGQLPPDQRQALELAYFNGLTQAEIARELGQPLGTVKARIRRAMLVLRESLKGRVEL